MADTTTATDKAVPKTVSLPESYWQRVDNLALARTGGNRSELIKSLVDDAHGFSMLLKETYAKYVTREISLEQFLYNIGQIILSL